MSTDVIGTLYCITLILGIMLIMVASGLLLCATIDNRRKIRRAKFKQKVQMTLSIDKEEYIDTISARAKMAVAVSLRKEHAKYKIRKNNTKRLLTKEILAIASRISKIVYVKFMQYRLKLMGVSLRIETIIRKHTQDVCKGEEVLTWKLNKMTLQLSKRYGHCHR